MCTLGNAAVWAQPAQRGPSPLAGMGSCQRTSAKTSCSSGASPPTLHSPAKGSSRNEAAKALCAATARRPDHRATHADRAADCTAAGAADARWRASKRSHVAPTTTKRQRRARTSSGYVWRRLRRAAWPGRASAPGCASPARVTGLTMVASIACWETCQSWRPLASVEREFGEPLRGWQRLAAAAGDERALELHLSHLDAASRALLLSQAGPHAARALTVFPTSPKLAVASPQLRVILLRRLRLALPVAPRACACRGRLDPLGDHRAACANAGVLASRALPLERAVARVCQEAGARVARKVRLADMNIDVPVSDDHRLEVVAWASTCVEPQSGTP